MKSKLFTPSVRSTQGTPIQREERAAIFMNPPTHAEIPVYVGPTDEGRPHYPLSLDGDRGTATRAPARRPVSAKNTTGNY